MGALPRWRNLNHFDHIMSVHFSDANKYEDILKVNVIFIILKDIAIFYTYISRCLFSQHTIFLQKRAVHLDI